MGVGGVFSLPMVSVCPVRCVYATLADSIRSPGNNVPDGGGCKSSLLRPELGIVSPETGVTDGCELLRVGTWNQTWVL